MGNNNSNSSGIGFCGLLFIVFLVLKLTNVIDWSWWWITAPLWIPAVIVLAIVIVFLMIKFFLRKRYHKACEKFEKKGKSKYGFASRLEKMQEEQERFIRNNKERKIEQS